MSSRLDKLALAANRNSSRKLNTYSSTDAAGCDLAILYVTERASATGWGYANESKVLYMLMHKRRDGLEHDKQVERLKALA
jgi:hypothetical protein